jgi:STE24 endopeptidase
MEATTAPPNAPPTVRATELTPVATPVSAGPTFSMIRVDHRGERQADPGSEQERRHVDLRPLVVRRRQEALSSKPEQPLRFSGRLRSRRVHRTDFSPFTPAERERAARYHRPLYLALLLRLALVVAVYASLAGSSLGGLGWAGDAAAWAAIVVTAATLVAFPLDLWRGYLREHRWSLSTQTLPAWLGDRAKSLAVAVVLAAGAWTAVVGVAHVWPDWWPLAASAGAALTVLFLTLVAPLVLEPLFNRFEPLPDERLARDLRDLADEAGVPVRDVLVADASRRTVKSNAYVSGLGPTRRVVVWDTLLAAADEAELKLVIAHELAHRRERHVLKGTLLAMAGAVTAVLLVWAALGAPQPGDFPLAVLILTGLELAALPFGAALSRRWERVADAYSLELTHDPAAYVRAHVGLARTNLSDLDPPRAAYLMLFTHPTPPERLALVESA